MAGLCTEPLGGWSGLHSFLDLEFGKAREPAGPLCDVMVATYDRHGISFVYPENGIQREPGRPIRHGVKLRVRGSGSGCCSYSNASLRESGGEALQSVKQEYDDIEVVRVRRENRRSPLRGIRLLFYCSTYVSSRVAVSQSITSSCALAGRRSRIEKTHRVAAITATAQPAHEWRERGECLMRNTQARRRGKGRMTRISCWGCG